MFKEKIDIPFCRLTEGQANLMLLAENQKLRALAAYKREDKILGDIHANLANHLEAVSNNTDLHDRPNSSALHYTKSNHIAPVINKYIVEASSKKEPSITLSKSDEKKFFANVFQSLNGNPIDEFDPTPDQITQCRSDAYQMALAELLKSARTFNPGTFDPNTEELHPIGTDGRLGVIKIVDLRAKEQQNFESCSSRVVMENIINKKLIEAGNLVIYRLMEDSGHDIAFNNKVNNRIIQQSAWINETAKATGLTFENVRLVLENSAININEETPSNTLASVSQLIADPSKPIPSTLPTLSSDQSSGNFVILIAKVVVEIVFAIVDAIKKRREDTFNEIKEPSIIAARCIDANIPLANCEGLPPDSPPSDGNRTLKAIGGTLLALGLGVTISKSRQNEFDEGEDEDDNDN